MSIVIETAGLTEEEVRAKANALLAEQPLIVWGGDLDGEFATTEYIEQSEDYYAPFGIAFDGTESIMAWYHCDENGAMIEGDDDADEEDDIDFKFPPKEDVVFEVYVDESANGGALTPKYWAVVIVKNQNGDDMWDNHIPGYGLIDTSKFDELSECEYTLIDFNPMTKEDFANEFAKRSGLRFVGFEDV